MKTFLVRGLPNSVQTDSWWMSEPPAPPRQGRRERSEPALPRIVALLALIVAGDALLWGASTGVSLALFGLIMLLTLWLLNGRRGSGALGFAALTFLPLIEQAQALSVMFFLIGMLLSVVWLALGGWPGAQRLLSGLWRFFQNAPEAAFRETQAQLSLVLANGPNTSAKSIAQSWFVPIGLGLVFASLLISANPMLEGWIDDASQVRWLSETALYRGLFWVGLAILALPVLTAPSLKERLMLAVSPAKALPVPETLNAQSICRSLILFNTMFAVQTGLDMAFLWGGAHLPEGMSYAQYAHRGAYPLLATALLAGAFALAARPFTSESPLLRVALLAWVAQNIFLVLSSLLRLELYVAQYGLTHLRIAAFIWMVVVALGLALVVYQTLRHKPASWLLARAGLLGVAALYLASFLSFSATIAQHNLSKPTVLDPAYVCALGPHAFPAILEYEARTNSRLCYGPKPAQIEFTDWREWGFRDWRLQRSLRALAAQQVEEVL